MKLTITIVIVVTLYLIGELPAHLTSRKSILNLLYGGDISKVDLQAMDRFEVISMTLNSLQLSINILVYAIINPSFMPEFFTCLRGASDYCFGILGFNLIAKCWSTCCLKLKNKNQSAVTSQSAMPAVTVTNNAATSHGQDISTIHSNSSCWSEKSSAEYGEEKLNATVGKRSWSLTNVLRNSSNKWKRSSSFGEYTYDNYGFDKMHN